MLGFTGKLITTIPFPVDGENLVISEKSRSRATKHLFYLQQIL